MIGWLITMVPPSIHTATGGALAGLSVENYNGSTVNSYGTKARPTEGATYRGGGGTRRVRVNTLTSDYRISCWGR